MKSRQSENSPENSITPFIYPIQQGEWASLKRLRRLQNDPSRKAPERQSDLNWCARSVGRFHSRYYLFNILVAKLEYIVHIL